MAENNMPLIDERFIRSGGLFDMMNDIADVNDRKKKRDGANQKEPGKPYSDSFLEEKWKGLTDIPFDEDEYGDLLIGKDYWIFDKGLDRDFIWHFFDENHSRGVVWLIENCK